MGKSIFSLLVLLSCGTMFCCVQGTNQYPSEPRTLVLVVETSMANELARLLKARVPRKVFNNYVIISFDKYAIKKPMQTSNFHDLARYLSDRIFKYSPESWSLPKQERCYKPSFVAIDLALSVAPNDSLVYVFTTADGEYQSYSYALEQSLEKRAQINFVVSEFTCPFSEQGNLKLYKDMAEATNGLFVQMEVASNVMAALWREELGTSSFDWRNLESGRNALAVPVDNHMKDFQVTVSGKQPQTIVVKNPNKEIYENATVIWDLQDQYGESPFYSTLLIVRNPEPGEWTINTDSDAEHTVKVDGNSDISFAYGFSPVPTQNGNQLRVHPFPKLTNYFSVVPLDPSTKINLTEVRFFNSREFFRRPLTRLDTAFVSSRFVPFETNFKVEISGVDESGNPFKRLLQTAISTVNLLKPEYRGGELNQFIVAEQKKRLRLSCEMTGDQRGMKFKWFRNYKVIADAFNDSLTVTAENDMILMCRASNSYGHETVTFHINYLQTKPEFRHPELETFNDYEQIYVDHIFVNKMDSITLNCDVVGNPKPTIQWFKVSDPFNHYWVFIENTSESTTELEIPSVDERSEFVCLATNENGQLQKHFLIEFHKLPEFEKRPKFNKPVKERHRSLRNGNLDLDCQTDNSTGVAIKWFKDGEKFPLNDQRQESISVLTLTNVTEAEEGIYHCVASNEFGSVDKYFDVHLIQVIKWGDWSEWSVCKCPAQIRSRSRECPSKKCVGDATEDRKCTARCTQMAYEDDMDDYDYHIETV